MPGWLFGLALVLVTEGADDEEAVEELLTESAGNLRTLEGAYGRAVALIGEFPDDPKVRQTIDLLAKTLQQGHRLVGAQRTA